MSQDSLWYRDAIIYQTHVRAFFDSNGDGIGDFAGLTAKLDYLRDLGVNAIWILPFYPSPLKDDGYDIADYTSVHRDYGSLESFKHFLSGAHRRDIRVITELVINHTSDQHPWFQRARRAPPGSSERDFYIWSNSPDRFQGVRVIFEDFESSNWSWDPVAGAHFWHRFYHHQPDLNYDNPEVVKAIYQIVDFWLEMGVDGFRLDAIPYLFKREGTSCENLPETHHLLRELRRHVDQKFVGRMFLAEANQWPEDAAAYFGNGDECHLAFHFPLMPRMFMALRMEDRYPILDVIEQTPQIPDACQWALFLRNHDELTLEMVTDEERDYMYQVYAHDPRARVNLGIRRRLAPLLENSRRRIELLNALLLSLPGTPVIYYGDEIGMGDNIYLGDRNGVRTPMQWTSDRNAGFSSANPQRLCLPVIIDPQYHYEAVNVETQVGNPTSLLWWMRRLIALRKRFKAFARGALRFLTPANRKVLAFIRSYQDEQLLVVANLSRFTQYVELDLSDLAGSTPVEMFGQTPFPPIGRTPYLVTLGPHNFFWFLIRPSGAQSAELGTTAEGAHLETDGDWISVFRGDQKPVLERLLAGYLSRHRWFCSRARTVGTVEVVDVVPLGRRGSRAAMALLRVRYTEGEPDTCALPICHAVGAHARRLLKSAPQDVLCTMATAEGKGILTDGLLEERVCRVLLDAILRGGKSRGKEGIVTGTSSRAAREILHAGAGTFKPKLAGTGRSPIVTYGRKFVLRFYRQIDEGLSADLDFGALRAERITFPHVPAFAGVLEYRTPKGDAKTLATLEEYVPNQGDAWDYTLDVLSRYFERMATRLSRARPPKLMERNPVKLIGDNVPAIARELIGVYLESARTIGIRTAELHLALAAETRNADLSPEPFTVSYQRSLYQTMRNQTDRVFELLRNRLSLIRDDARANGEELLRRKGEVIARFHALMNERFSAQRMRIHGNFRLGKILCAGKEFVIIDFCGQSFRSAGTRRIKRSPLLDVAGIMSSFHCASRTAMERFLSGREVSRRHRTDMKSFADFWNFWVEVAFLSAYIGGVGERPIIPRDHLEIALLLDIFRLEDLISDLGESIWCQPEEVPLLIEEILDSLAHPLR